MAGEESSFLVLHVITVGFLFIQYMHFNPSTSLKIDIEMTYIDVQKCIHSVQGFSLFKVVLLWDVPSNTRLFFVKL